jgi:hypothetical protein
VITKFKLALALKYPKFVVSLDRYVRKPVYMRGTFGGGSCGFNVIISLPACRE